MSCGISSSFPEVFPTSGQVTHVLLTRPPLGWRSCPLRLARLACVKHAASVHSEPGSNSPLKSVRPARVPFGIRRRLIRVRPALSRQDSGFPKTRKRKRRLARSTQFSRNRIPGATPRERRRPTGVLRPEGQSCSLRKPICLVNAFPRGLAETTRKPRTRLGKNEKPCGETGTL